MMTNWIICPIYNGLAMTKALIPDLLSQDIGNVEVLFLLNGCKDGSASYIRSLGNRRLHLVNVPMPHGVSRAWNHGLNWCFENGSEYVLVINNDIRLRPDAYRRLVEDGGSFVTGVGTKDIKVFEAMGEPRVETRPHPDFSCFLIRRTVWEHIGPLDELFVNYCGDGDYHFRMMQAGITAYCLDLPFYHIGSGTLNEMEDDERKLLLEITDQDRASFVEKWGFRMGSDKYYAEFGHGRPNDPGAARD